MMLEDRIGFLAMKFRSTKDDSERLKIAEDYKNIILQLTKSGTWKDALSFEEMLPSDYMPSEYYEYWKAVKMKVNLKNIIIPAPFGNYLSHPNATSTLGTFTLKRRGGMIWRAWRCLASIRYNWRTQSYINKLGLPNPGLRSLPAGASCKDKIVSIHGFDPNEWMSLVDLCASYRPMAVELNLSCPNVKKNISSIDKAISNLLDSGLLVIAKLPPVKWMDLAKPLWENGVRVFHCCNTIPTPGGGLSGKVLKQYSLWAVEDLKGMWGDKVRVIGGGGVTSLIDVMDFTSVGADHVSVGSKFLNPFNLIFFNSFMEKINRYGF